MAESSVERRRGMRGVLRKEVTPDEFEKRRLYIATTLK
jgi:hypothetical protein